MAGLQGDDTRRRGDDESRVEKEAVDIELQRCINMEE
jgi:hypothetical protein